MKTRIVFRVWHESKSVCDGKNHFREKADGSKNWFESCPYLNPNEGHRKLKDEYWPKINQEVA